MATIFKIAAGVALVAVLVVGLVLLLGGGGGGGDDGGDDAQDADSKKAGSGAAKRPATASGDGKSFGFGRASGQFKSIEASGTVKQPGVLLVKISSAPKQATTVSYAMVCTRTGGGAVNSMGQRKVSTPGSFEMKKPAGKLKRCDVFANAQLTKRGRMKLSLVG